MLDAEAATALPPAPDAGEAPVIARARAGDEAALRQIMRSHNRRLFRVARAVLGHDDEAEDVVQETYVRAFTALDRFRGESSLATWLTRIALNEALMRRRRRRPTVALTATGDDSAESPAMTVPDPAAGPEAAYGRTQIRGILQAAIDTLPEPFRLVFMLREVEELSVEDTAAQLGLQSETVRTRLFRARRLLRQRLQAELQAGLTEIFPFAGARCDALADAVLARMAAANR